MNLTSKVQLIFAKITFYYSKKVQKWLKLVGYELYDMLIICPKRIKLIKQCVFQDNRCLK